MRRGPVMAGLIGLLVVAGALGLAGLGGERPADTRTTDAGVQAVRVSSDEPRAQSAARTDLIAYSRRTARGEGIVTINPVSRARVVLTDRAGRVDTEPDWSPDGKRIVFERSTDGRRSIRIYVMRADGSGVRRITGGQFDLYPTWSPSGEWIAYADRDGAVRLIRPDGTGNRRVPGGDRGGQPAWSPDGRLLSFTVGPDSRRRLVAQRPGGAERRTIAERVGWTSDWSPDGRRLVITGHDGGVDVVAASGGEPRRLSKGFEPRWSPDGERIAYTRWPPDNRFELWVMRADGSAARRITRDAHSPDWRPVVVGR